mgnify:CR=1 FL=1|tara:strand:+ start:4227 stop:4511 length:285 start_codon:yes stop_codon:yes gene_type:complete
MSNKQLVRPYVTEKTSSLITENKFTFLCLQNINKIEIKKQLSSQYEINIGKINVLKRFSKKVRRGKTLGEKRGYLKVIITLKDDKNIDKLKDLF